MPQKEDKSTAPQANPMANMFGDMSLLRDIIMGPKVIEYDQHFADNDALIKENDIATKQRFDALEKEMNNRFDRLEQLLMQNVEKLNTQLQSMSKNDKAHMADLLIEMSKKLKD
jgi:CHASE3 domain sensor protein